MTIKTIGAAAALGVVLLFAPMFAQSTTPEQAAPATGPRAGMMGMMGMMNHQQMMADMKAADSRLQELVTRMNAAKGDQKVEAMAALLTELVRNESNLHHRMMEMHGQMEMRGRMMQQTPQK